MVGRIEKYETVGGLVSEQCGFWKSVSTDNVQYKLMELIF